MAKQRVLSPMRGTGHPWGGRTGRSKDKLSAKPGQVKESLVKAFEGVGRPEIVCRTLGDPSLRALSRVVPPKRAWPRLLGLGRLEVLHPLRLAEVNPFSGEHPELMLEKSKPKATAGLKQAPVQGSQNTDRKLTVDL